MKKKLIVVIGNPQTNAAAIAKAINDQIKVGEAIHVLSDVECGAFIRDYLGNGTVFSTDNDLSAPDFGKVAENASKDRVLVIIASSSDVARNAFLAAIGARRTSAYGEACKLNYKHGDVYMAFVPGKKMAMKTSVLHDSQPDGGVVTHRQIGVVRTPGKPTVHAKQPGVGTAQRKAA